MQKQDIYNALEYNDINQDAVLSVEKVGSVWWNVIFDATGGGANIPTDIRNPDDNAPGWWLFSVSIHRDAGIYLAVYRECE